VFLYAGGSSPAADLRHLILLAGDVERNPGPLHLRVLQLNANGIKKRRIEIAHRLLEDKIDVAVIQETNLSAGVDDPKFDGYTVVGRKDRPRGRFGRGGGSHGGVLILVKVGIMYSESNIRPVSAADDITEFDSVDIHLEGSTLSLLNLYVPPLSGTDGRGDLFECSNLPNDRNVIVCGDLNAHGSWDHNYRSDKRGAFVDDFCEQQDFVALNSDGSHTRRSPSTASVSSPDVTLVHSSMAEKCKWKTTKSVGSDHLPILIDITIGEIRVPRNKFKGKPKYSLKTADWMEYREAVDEAFRTSWLLHENVHVAAKLYTQLLTQVCDKVFPKGHLKRDAKAWWCKEVQEIIQLRNKAEAEAGQSEGKRSEWRSLRKKAEEVILQAKTAHWRKYVEDLNPSVDPGKVFGVIRAINGDSRTPSHQALKVGGKLITTRAKKADTLLKTYLSNCRPDVRSEEEKKAHLVTERAIRHEGKLAGKEMCIDPLGAYSPFSLPELGNVLRSLSDGKAPGIDMIGHEMFKHLPPSAREGLLHVLNLSWKAGEVPDAWKHGQIIFIPKGGDQSNPSNYRPIQLLNTISKVMEALVNKRLMNWLETNGTLHQSQAGFRAGRSAEEQVAVLAAAAEDGFQDSKKGHAKKGIMFLADFSKAYDRVWHTGLFCKMARLGIPSSIIRWVRGLLADRKVSCELDGFTTKKRIIRHGIPQGSALAPTLWLCYVNDLAVALDNAPGGDRALALYADDVTSMVMEENLDIAVQTTQSLASTLAWWAQRWKVTANARKTKVMLITLDPRLSGLKCQVRVTMGDVVLEQVKSARVLGVIMDEGMRFTEHVATVAAKAKRRLRTLTALRGTDWGRSSKELHNLYSAYILPGMEYGAATVATMASPSALEPAEVVHRSAARIISGCTINTRKESLMRESNMLPIRQRGEVKALIAREKYLRLPNEVPAARIVVRPRIPPKKKHSRDVFRETWCEVARKAAVETGLEGALREPVMIAPDALCPATDLLVTFDMCIGDVIKASDPKSVKYKAATRHIQRLPPSDLELWTDGSVDQAHPMLWGGAGFLLKRGRTNLHEGATATGPHCSSFWAEARALEEAMKQVIAKCSPNDKSLYIFTDSRSVVERLQTGRTLQRELIGKRCWDLFAEIASRGITTALIWVPSHCNLRYNEVADKLAERGVHEDASLEKVPFAAAKAVAKRYGEKKWFKSIDEDTHRDEWHFQVMGTNKVKLAEGINVQDGRILAQLRSGKCPITMDYLFSIGKAASPLCPACKHDDDSVKHLLLDCGFYKDIRRECLGSRPKPEVLHTEQKRVIKYLSTIGRLSRAMYPPDGGAGAPQ
jgi:ribonuclease HI